MEKTVHLFLYDFIVCFYIFGLIFIVIWTAIGHSYYDNEPKDSPCRKQDDGFVMIAALINLLATDFFLIFGFIAFVITLTMYACDDGR
jgi:NADH:ubiquinone oxidoreductase subunit 6 (subunit J)